MSTLNDERKAQMVRAWIAKPPPALMDAAHPQHSDYLASWNQLHTQAGATGTQQQAGPDALLDATSAAKLVANRVAWTAAEAEGHPLSEQDRSAAQSAVAASIVQLSASETEGQRLTYTLDGALRRGRGGMTMERAMRTLVAQHGEEGARQVIQRANATLAHLDAAGIKATAGLRALGVGNDPHLTNELAAFSERLKKS
jgi:hypothetical protein